MGQKYNLYNLFFWISVLLVVIMVTLLVLGLITPQDMIGVSIGATVLSMLIIVIFLGRYRQDITKMFPKYHIIVKGLIIILFFGLMGFLGFLLSKI